MRGCLALLIYVLQRRNPCKTLLGRPKFAAFLWKGAEWTETHKRCLETCVPRRASEYKRKENTARKNGEREFIYIYSLQRQCSRFWICAGKWYQMHSSSFLHRLSWAFWELSSTYAEHAGQRFLSELLKVKWAYMYVQSRRCCIEKVTEWHTVALLACEQSLYSLFYDFFVLPTTYLKLIEDLTNNVLKL